uniref:Putative secreted peptide n=1 Tax=Rhipicephalus pulchellus TaxID=72859 RepID=L7MCE1_RHIPC
MEVKVQFFHVALLILFFGSLLSRTNGRTSSSLSVVGIAQPCSIHKRCARGLCCLKQGQRKTCHSLSRHRQPCSSRIMEGYYYERHCPCQTGTCRGNICT